MATSKVNSPLNCSICLEKKDQKSPRMLPCHHSFCLECLESWHTKDYTYSLTCPECRKRTPLPDGGIKALPFDFRLEQFASFLNSEKFLQICQACDHSRDFQQAKVVCKTCKLQFCEKCSKEHIQMSIFSSHEINHAMCEIHGAAMEYVCETCSAGICVRCVYSGYHKKHKIIDVESGLPNIIKNVENLKSELVKSISACDSEIESKLQQCLNDERQSEEKIKNIGNRIKETIDIKVKETIDLHKIRHEELLTEQFRKYKDDSKRIASTNGEVENILKKDDAHILVNMKNVTATAKGTISAVKALKSTVVGLNTHLIQCSPISKLEKVLDDVQKYHPVCSMISTLSKNQGNLVLLRKFECSQDSIFDSPWNVNVTSAGDVIVCNYNGGAPCEVFKDGTVKTLHGIDATAACVNNNGIYFIHSSGEKLIKLSDERNEKNKTLYLSYCTPRSIGVIDDQAFIYTDFKLVKCSLTNSSRKVISDNGLPGSLVCTSAGGNTILAITDRRANKVVVYDQTGKEIRSFGEKGSGDGQMNSPAGIKIMANGHFLLADRGNHRIVEYMPDGTFVQNVLTQKDGLYYPSDVAFLYPYMWVTEYVTFKDTNKKMLSVKLFKYS